MKKKNISVVCVAVLMAAAMVFSGCGSSGSDKGAGAASSSAEYNSNGYIDSESAFDSAKGEVNPDTAGGTSLTVDTATQLEESQRKVIKYVELSMETKEFDSTLEAILSIVEQAGGYIDSQNVNSPSLNYSGRYYQRNAYIAARIPTEGLDSVTAAVRGVCNVSSESSSREDITDYYYDSEAHLNSLKTQEQRLLELMEQASNIEDIITLESALSEVRYEIESLQGQLRRMDNQVAYSYLNMSLQEVVEYSETVVQPATFGEKLSEAASNAWEKLTGAAEGIVLFIVENGPVLILWAVIIWLVVWAVITITRRRRAAKTAKYRRAAQQPERPAAGPAVEQPRNETEKPEETGKK